MIDEAGLRKMLDDALARVPTATSEAKAKTDPRVRYFAEGVVAGIVEGILQVKAFIGEPE